MSDTSALNYVRGAPELRVIAAMGRKRSRFFPDTPTVFELMKLGDEQAWLLDFHSTVEDLGRILVTAPDVPAARLNFLRKAVEATLRSPVLIEEGERTQRYIDFIDAAATEKGVVRAVESMTPQQRKLVQDIIGRSEGK